MEKLPNSVETLLTGLAQKKSYKPSEVVKIVKQAQITPEDLMFWSDFNHPKTDSYGRKLVHKSPNFEVMVMSWAPGDMSAIHDHGFATWGAVQIFGENEHAIFKVKDGEISTLSRTNFNYGQIVGVEHNLVHQMGNTTNENILTLHIYGLEEAKENVTGDANLYDVENNEIQIINGGVFYDLPASEIAKKINGPIADFPTRLRDIVELGKRIRLIDPTSDKIEEVVTKIQSAEYCSLFNTFISTVVDENDVIINLIQWKILMKEIDAANVFLGINNLFDLLKQSTFCEVEELV